MQEKEDKEKMYEEMRYKMRKVTEEREESIPIAHGVILPTSNYNNNISISQSKSIPIYTPNRYEYITIVYISIYHFIHLFR